MEHWMNPKPKFGSQKWFENYWYHYKWHTIVSIFLVVIITSFVYDLLTKEKFDAEIAITCTTYVDYSQQEPMARKLEEYSIDADGDGFVNVGVFLNQFPGENGDPQMMIAAQTKFMAELSDGTSMILILDEDIYGLLEDQDFCADLSPYTDKAYDGGRKVKLADTPLGSVPELENLKDKLFLTLRAPETHAVTKNEKTLAKYEAQKELLINLLSENAVNTPAAPPAAS